MKLLECIIVADGQRRKFEFEGNVKIIEEGPDPYAEFEDLCIYEHTEGGREIFEPEGITWHGEKIDAEYAINDVLCGYSRNETEDYEVLFICEELEKFAGRYKSKIALTYETRDIPYRILHGAFCETYFLFFATNEYLFYMRDDTDVVMLQTHDGGVVSDNYFATVGYDQSEEAVHSGEEIALSFVEYEE